MDDRTLMKLALRGYRPRALLANVELLTPWYHRDSENPHQVARGTILKSYDTWSVWEIGEVVTTSPIQEVSPDRDWIITENSLYLVDSWAEA